MGLIRQAVDQIVDGVKGSAGGAISSTIADQWQDYIKCDSLSDDVLMVKMTTPSGQITSKSRIQVADGQVAIIFESGKILDATAEAGIYTFDASTSPSILSGQFGDVFKEAFQRFKYNGTPAKEQAVYYVNIKEIKDNKFGSPNAVTYRDPVYREIYIRYHGNYSFKISNPIVFFEKIAGNVKDKFTRDDLMAQADAEFSACVAGAIGRCADAGCGYAELTSRQQEIAEYMNDALDEKWRKLRGIEVESVAIFPSIDDKSRDRVDSFNDEFARSDYYSQQDKAAGRMVTATASAMEKAADNDKGAATGFMGLGLMNMAANNFNGGQSPVAFTQPAGNNAPTPEPAAPAAPAAPEVHCPQCGSVVTGKFCSECGAPAPEAKANVCPKCGAETLEGAKFCVECGQQL